jgi:predicted ribosomally synthesized peptide with nif11-like leader
MSREILEKVKGFLIQLVKDESFRTQLMSEKIEEVKKVMADSGYNFSQDEFEKATIKILELKELGQFQDLTEDELVGAVGGLTTESPIFQPLYGVIIDPPEGVHPKPRPFPLPYPRPRPRPCICKKPPIDVQPMYGVIRPTEYLTE